MKTTSRPCLHVLALAATLVGCGGSGQGANGPAGAGPSKISAKFESPDHKLDVTGPAFATVITTEKTAFTDKTTRLGIYVFASNTEPAPTCETISKAGALGQLTRGGFVSFTMDKVADGPGKVDVVEVGALMGDSDKGDLFMTGGKVTNMSIMLRSYDKTFAGDVTTSAGGGTTASGTLAGTVCPPATIADPNAAAAGGGKVEDPSAGMSTNDTAGMPPPPEPPPEPPPPATKPKTKPKPKAKPKTPKPAK